MNIRIGIWINSSTSIALAAALAFTLPTPAYAQQQTYAFDIPASNLANALSRFGRTTRQQLVYNGAQARQARSAAVNGTMTAQAALTQRLQGSGFSFRVGNAGVMIIERSAIPGSGEAQAAGAAAENESVSDQEIVVTGSRLGRSAGDEGPAPVTTLNREFLDQLAVTNVADALTYLPQQPFSNDEQTAFGGARVARLRGLPAGSTLVLLNGRRTVTSAATGQNNTFDLNSIPMAAVDRIEVLGSSSSAIYGADAVGGVVNIILKEAVERPVVEAFYGFADGGADERRLSVSLGLDTGRFRGSVIFDAFGRDYLFGYQREVTRSADFTSRGGGNFSVTTSNPGNISSATAANLPGLPSTFAAVPVGSSGVGLTPASFLATAGTRNTESIFQFASIVPRARRYAALGTVAYDLSPAVTAFAEILVGTREDTRIQTPRTLSNVLVPATNAFNPFGTAVRASYRFEAPREETTKAQFWRGVAGVRGSWRDWDWELSYLHSDEDAESLTINGTLNNAAVTAALASNNPATALNVFQDGPGGSADLLSSLFTPQPVEEYASGQRQIGGFARGDLFTLPAGPLQLVVGGEVRWELLDFRRTTVTTRINRNRQTKAGYIELGIPIVAEAMSVPLVRRLTATAAARYDHYSDFGGTFNPQFGLEWELNRHLLARAAYGTSFRAPSLFELFQARTNSTVNLADPLRGNAITSVTQTVGGNPDLQPEEGNSLTAGLVVRPFGGTLRLEASYWRVEQSIRILRPGSALIVANENLFPDRVVRGTPSPADPPGFAGPILSVDASTLNAGSLLTDGVDFQISNEFRTGIGRFGVNLAATWVSRFRSATVPTAPIEESVDVVNTLGGSGSIPEWRATGRLTWTHGPLGVAATIRWTEPYADLDLSRNRNGRSVRPPTTVDLQASYEFGREGSGPLSGLRLAVGANNLFDRPTAFTTSNTFGYDTTASGFRQRFIYVSVSKTF
jgi:iron complex outermembrane recepter protein